MENKVKRRAFYSFHYANDAWRTGQVRNIGTVDGSKPASDNDWEKLRKTGDAAVKKWINEQIANRSVVIVLIGEETASRPWVKYEIRQAWEQGKGLVGIYVHGLKDQNRMISNRGSNPFSEFTITVNGKKRNFADFVPVYNPQGTSSTDRYNHIAENLADWVENGISAMQDLHEEVGS